MREGEAPVHALSIHIPPVRSKSYLMKRMEYPTAKASGLWAAEMLYALAKGLVYVPLLT